MYTKDQNKLSNKIDDLLRYIEGYDVTNSVLLRELPKLVSAGSTEVIYPRYDLLAQEIYESDRFDWVLMIYTGINEKDLVTGSFISYPSLDSVKELIMSLNTINKV